LAFTKRETSQGITKEFAEEWSKKKLNEAEINHYTRVSYLMQSSSYLSDLGIASYIPKLPPYPKSNFAPYIFSKQELNALFRASDELSMSCFFMTSPLISIPPRWRFLYGTGLRISEATSLINKNVNLEEGYLLVKDGKSGKERTIPISESLVSVLKEYVSYREQLPLMKKSEYFFIKLDGSPIKCHESVRQWFIKCLQKAGINYIGRHKGPRIHDLRHTFACHSLAGMAESGMDLYTSLPILSSYLGHGSLASTNSYVRLTANLYPELIQNRDIFFLNVFPDNNE
jgi:integrase